MAADLIEVLRISSNVSVVVPLGVLIYKSKSLPKQHRIIGTLVLLYALLDICGYIFLEQGASTAILFNVGQILQFFVVGWFYYEVMFKNFEQPICHFSIAVFIIAFIFISMLHQPFTQNQSTLWALSALICVGYGLFMFHYLMVEPPVLNNHIYSTLWFNGGLFLYFSFNLVLLALSNFIFTELEPEISRMIWGFHNLNNVIKNLALAMGFTYTGRGMIAK
jgi:hypothetical protein